METERLYFRRWSLDDKEQLFSLAKDPDVGYRCGWPAHRTIEDSIRVIKTVFTGDENYAICLKGTDLPIGCVELMVTKRGQEKLGFVFQEKKENVKVTLLDEYRNDYINLLTREDWEKENRNGN